VRLRTRALLPGVILLVGALAAALILALRPRVEPGPAEPTTPLVRVIRADPRDVRFTVRAQGTVVPRTESELVPQVSGEIVWMSPALVSGGFFEAGEPLVRIDPSDYELELAVARATGQRAESELSRARTERERQRALASKLAASQSRIDDADNAFRVAEASLAEARARRARAERDLARTELRAPYAGRVRRESADVGQFANRGTPIAMLYAVDYAEVRLPIPDRELAYLDLPLGLRESGDADPEAAPAVLLHAEFAGEQRVWPGRLVRTEGEIDPRSRMVTAVARVEDPYGRSAGASRPPLAVGLFVDAEIEGRRVEGALVLPRSALREGGVVLAVDDENRLRIRPVEVLRTQGDEVVIGSGLEAGERVCISPLPGAVDGMEVRIAQDAAAVAELRP
jgi:RND family efflux transporter MFP subunit